ncbi:GTP pyrophosphokinase [Desulfobacter hydrogenophilus]|uniref:Bifunctional (P)ppGpp synthetase/guanosine-3',5'-bis(Diphosphate) 3'-pyrophosphohydrolase n=1 Tax=Desulfobacter hydrogenophilus TaxID=2291 RepID=A0A328F9V0_9BACT|nr:HD domain-containing protein [Desulfobacter hydrogenophilus]NDY73833.1 bifunctional (p)ppGpp synthetase/guanosine-3',5'-bis(diphosphate) 3'-pyrophosphohydrolase [Desulfobacter hydrogenophilus]QBH13156.1 bifunctional (p)ppGpp synthetase/guanosine-3',5'-bis(diphosphate) 3'-pyrophosphohydrolase [Desulfobacter hydrogenophilus]RAM00450.1 GTP pyrophosphokinase [Desulfobacter hydrogenophilus]
MPKTAANLEDAIILAARAHKGQVDKAGEPYILHPLHVMLCMKTNTERIVAVLHDVMEDTDYSDIDLIALGFSPNIVEALKCLSKSDAESYFDYIDRVKTNKNAKRVKIADLTHNMDMGRIPEPTREDLARKEKYIAALKQINA